MRPTRPTRASSAACARPSGEPLPPAGPGRRRRGGPRAHARALSGRRRGGARRPRRRARRLRRRAARARPRAGGGDARLGGRMAGVSPARPRRAALDRATVVRERGDRGRHRPGARVRHRGARLDPSRPRAARPARALGRARPRVRFGRAVDRRRRSSASGRFRRSTSTRWRSARRPRTPPETGSRSRSPRADVLTDPLPAAPLWLANLELGLLRRLLERADLPERILASGLTADQGLGGSPRVEVDGWAAEVLHP